MGTSVGDQGKPLDGSGRPVAAVQALSLKAFDLSERAARLGVAEQRRRVARWRSQAFMITQAAFGSAFAWWVSLRWLDHPQPVFAAVSAIIALGLSHGQRVSRVVEVCVGVALGVLLGDLFAQAFGIGFWQIALVVVLAMSVASWLGARTLMVNQAGIQAATVMTLLPRFEQGGDRVVDALVGCTVALVLALLAPAGPIRRPRIRAAEVLHEVSGSLRAAREALVEGDQALADAVLDRSRASEGQLVSLQAAAAEGVAVVRYSPFLRGHRDHVQQVADLVAPLDRLTRNLRVLARRTAVAVWRGDEVPTAYSALMGQVADAVDFCAAELFARRIPTRARERIVALAQTSSHAPLTNSLSATVILAQLRSILVDLLELTGMDYDHARDLVPEMD